MAEKLVSPAKKGEEDQAKDEIEKDLMHLDPDFQEDPNMLGAEEIGDIPDSAASTPHPFAGYPVGRLIRLIGTDSKNKGTSSTFIVLLKDKDIFQDPSGKGVDHVFFAKDKTGEDIKGTDADGRFKPAKVKSRKIINLRTSHNRVTTNPGGGRDSHDSVFDRKVMVKNRGEMMCAIIPDPIHRAMVCFKLEKGRMVVDKRYMLADPKQKGRLRDVFRKVHYQQMKAERLAQKHYSDPSDQDE